MNDNKVDSLIASLQTLKQAISKAERHLRQYAKPESDAITHMESYRDICNKQLEFAYLASGAMEDENSDEAFRLVNIINELAQLVKDDARQVLLGRDLSENQRQHC